MVDSTLSPATPPNSTDDYDYDDYDYHYDDDNPYGYEGWGNYYYTDTYTFEDDPDAIFNSFDGALDDGGKWAEVGRKSAPTRFNQEGDILTNKTVQYTPLQQYPHFEGDIFQVFIGLHLLLGTVLFILVSCCAINQTWQRSHLMVSVRDAERVIMENGCCGSYGCCTGIWCCKRKNRETGEREHVFKTCAEKGFSMETFLQYVCFWRKEPEKLKIPR